MAPPQPQTLKPGVVTEGRRHARRGVGMPGNAPVRAVSHRSSRASSSQVGHSRRPAGTVLLLVVEGKGPEG